MMLVSFAVISLFAGMACQGDRDTAPSADVIPQAVAKGEVGAVSNGAIAERPGSGTTALTEAEKKFYRDVARQSWSYFEANYQPATGLVSATYDWDKTTLWDIGAQILAFHAAKELGLLSEADYEARTGKTLATLERLPLYRNTAFAKLYETKKLGIGAGRSGGWSATDLGRFLVALKILAEREPRFAAQAERIARRNDFTKIVKDGYLQGQHLGANGKPWTFQEGRIGYEQYVAAGFSKWGADVGKALDIRLNSEPTTVLGVPLLADKRYQDRLLSEPFILQGIELGLSGDMRELAVNLLRAQEARYKSTGKMTMVSEDAVSVAPDYFYYYCVLCNRKPFVIGISNPSTERSSPRWVSTKAAFGWHALMPSDYTQKAMEFVSAAQDGTRGWASGVYEDSRASTKTFDINTAAVLLEIAYYQLRGGVPLIEAAPKPAN